MEKKIYIDTSYILSLLNNDHPAKNKVKQEERINGEERSVFLNLGSSEKVYRRYQR